MVNRDISLLCKRVQELGPKKYFPPLGGVIDRFVLERVCGHGIGRAIARVRSAQCAGRSLYLVSGVGSRPHGPGSIRQAREANDHTHGARRKHGGNGQQCEEHLHAEVASNEGTADDRPEDRPDA